MNDTEII